MKRKHFAPAAAALFGLLTLTVKPPRLFIINLTASLPRGLYYVSSRPPRRFDRVIINSGRLAFTGGLRNVTLLKRVAFASGEHVILTPGALMIGGDFALAKHLPIGITGEWLLRDGEAVLLGDSARSFDSRYFGPVRLADCTRVVPLLLFDRGDARGRR
jgi:type IV secretory pathway protease TraF